MRIQTLRVIMFIGAVCLFAPVAFGQTCEYCTPEYPTDGFAGWETLEPMGYNPPTIGTCTAYGQDNNQTCRECARAYYDNGVYKGYDVCAYVKYQASCKCQKAGTKDCYGEGVCTYVR